MAYDEKLAARIREIVEEHGPFEERKMFGGMTFMRHGRMCCGVLHDDLVVRVTPETAEQAEQEPHVRPFDFTGRPMAGMFYVGPEGVRHDAALRRWVLAAVEYSDSQPPKPAKKPKRSNSGAAARKA